VRWTGYCWLDWTGGIRYLVSGLLELMIYVKGMRSLLGQLALTRINQIIGDDLASNWHTAALSSQTVGRSTFVWLLFIVIHKRILFLATTTQTTSHLLLAHMVSIEPHANIGCQTLPHIGDGGINAVRGYGKIGHFCGGTGWQSRGTEWCRMHPKTR
jgi:hypothetical protein